jgi:hypothetical protein
MTYTWQNVSNTSKDIHHVGLYACVHTYIYIHTYRNIFVHTYINKCIQTALPHPRPDWSWSRDESSSSVYIRMYVTVYMSMNVCMYICMCLCMYVSMFICMVFMHIYKCMYVCMHLCMYVCINACMYACMYVCIYVCVSICVCMEYIYGHAHIVLCTSKSNTISICVIKTLKNVVAMWSTRKNWHQSHFESYSSWRHATFRCMLRRGFCVIWVS